MSLAFIYTSHIHDRIRYSHSPVVTINYLSQVAMICRDLPWISRQWALSRPYPVSCCSSFFSLSITSTLLLCVPNALVCRDTYLWINTPNKIYIMSRKVSDCQNRNHGLAHRLYTTIVTTTGTLPGSKRYNLLVLGLMTARVGTHVQMYMYQNMYILCNCLPGSKRYNLLVLGLMTVHMYRCICTKTCTYYVIVKSCLLYAVYQHLHSIQKPSS